MYREPIDFNNIAYQMDFNNFQSRIYGMGVAPMAYGGVASSGLNPTGAQFAAMQQMNNMHSDIRSRLSLYDQRAITAARFMGQVWGGRSGGESFSNTMRRSPMLGGLFNMGINHIAAITGTQNIFGTSPADFGGGVIGAMSHQGMLNNSYLDSQNQIKMVEQAGREMYQHFTTSSGFSNSNARGFSGKELNRMLELGVATGGVKNISFEKTQRGGYELSKESIRNMKEYVEGSAEMFRELTDVYDSRDFAELAMVAEKMTGVSLSKGKEAISKITKSFKEFASTAKSIGMDQQEFLSVIEGGINFGISQGGSPEFMRAKSLNMSRSMYGFRGNANLARNVSMPTSVTTDPGKAAESLAYNATAMDYDSDNVRLSAMVYALQDRIGIEKTDKLLKPLANLPLAEKITRVDELLKVHIPNDNQRASSIALAAKSGHFSASGIQGLIKEDSYTRSFLEESVNTELLSRVETSISNILATKGDYTREETNAATVSFTNLADTLGYVGAYTMFGESASDKTNVKKAFIERRVRGGAKREDAERQWAEIEGSVGNLNPSLLKHTLSALDMNRKLNPYLDAIYGASFAEEERAIAEREKKLYGGTLQLTEEMTSTGITDLIRRYVGGNKDLNGSLEEIAALNVGIGEGAASIPYKDVLYADRISRDFSGVDVESEEFKAFSKRILEYTGVVGTLSGKDSPLYGLSEDALKQPETWERIARGLTDENLQKFGYATIVDSAGGRRIISREEIETEQLRLENQKRKQNTFLPWGSSGIFSDIIDPKGQTTVAQGTLGPPSHHILYGAEAMESFKAKLKNNKNLNDAQRTAIERAVSGQSGIRLLQISDPDELEKQIGISLQNQGLSATGDPTAFKEAVQVLMEAFFDSAESHLANPTTLARTVLGMDEKKFYGLAEDPVQGRAVLEQLDKVIEAASRNPEEVLRDLPLDGSLIDKASTWWGNVWTSPEDRLTTLKEKREKYAKYLDETSKNNFNDAIMSIIGKLSDIITSKGMKIIDSA